MNTLLNRVRHRAVGYRRLWCERMGIDWYSKPARCGMDEKLQAYLPPRGFFVEVGAHDGYSDSNTYYLERIKKWKGVLIEPISGNYKACRIQRPNSMVFNAAVVAADYGKPTISMTFADRSSTVHGAFGDEAQESAHIQEGARFVKTHLEVVPARTLKDILTETKVKEIDFFSLDVEGYECEALKGMDWDRHAPNYFLIECLTSEMHAKVRCCLDERYDLVCELSRFNFLFKKRILK